ncbi:basic helix-loop-helix (bHLH) DNA-bindingsuperfamily protein [Striga asiatica]|uniref:Basic helix-loop-helix (BHLH) DNA-bindingsuperfamily protein n=1 Tax=Striga asiatica TaxID=4170 RepID=A0A5A7QQC1_STRAF|nr:basic helix-loop-helix (bHLH) DNA-bindingsuperfamily protein [Striga asiatica]
MENCYWPGEYGPWGYNQGESSAAAAALQYHLYGPPWGLPYGEAAPGDRAASASRSHSEAEKRRRDRINAQLSTLRKLIPKSDKMDKAALLGHVVEQVREHSKIAKEVSKSSAVPTETDEVTVDHSNDDSSQDNRNIYFRASICCDDRPELFAELNGAIKGLGLIIHHAEITSIGGRMKSNLILCANNNNNDDNDNNEKKSCRESIKQSLKLALSRVVISVGSSGYTARSKRQRISEALDCLFCKFFPVQTFIHEFHMLADEVEGILAAGEATYGFALITLLELAYQGYEPCLEVVDGVNSLSLTRNPLHYFDTICDALTLFYPLKRYYWKWLALGVANRMTEKYRSWSDGQCI